MSRDVDIDGSFQRAIMDDAPWRLREASITALKRFAIQARDEYDRLDQEAQALTEIAAERSNAAMALELRAEAAEAALAELRAAVNQYMGFACTPGTDGLGLIAPERRLMALAQGVPADGRMVPPGRWVRPEDDATALTLTAEEAWERDADAVGRAAHEAWKRWIVLGGYADHAMRPGDSDHERCQVIGCPVEFAPHLHHPDMISWEDLPQQKADKYIKLARAGYLLGFAARAKLAAGERM